MRAILLSVALALASGAANAQGEVETADPLKAFVFEQYRRGSDYFINGNGSTVLLRCVAVWKVPVEERVARWPLSARRRARTPGAMTKEISDASAQVTGPERADFSADQ